MQLSQLNLSYCFNDFISSDLFIIILIATWRASNDLWNLCVDILHVSKLKNIFIHK